MQKTQPTFGEPVPGEGGRLVAIMRGALVNSERQPDYALILAEPTKGDLGQLAWGRYGLNVPNADSLTDGLSNTRAMCAAGCTLALKLQKLTIEGHKDWYLASRAEYWAARANTPELFAKEWHWTSTQLSALIAFVQDFETGLSHWHDKVSSHRVRAFRRIPLYHFNA